MVREPHSPDTAGRRVLRFHGELHVVLREEADGSVTGHSFVERSVGSECPRVGSASRASPVLMLEALHALRRCDERAPWRPRAPDA
jgi:hypothetical protein